MKKICFVVQRYGLEVNGGAELQSRLFAEHLLSKYNEIHVLTTKAVDYMTWSDYYHKDEEVINGVTVHRFSVAAPRRKEEFDEINHRFMSGKLQESEEQEWMEKQGPYVPALIDYIRRHKDDYDVFVFFTYIYYTTAMGIREVADKAIMIPEAHDEPFLKMKIFDPVFKSPRAFFLNTEEERALIHSKYHNENIPTAIGGIGLDVPENVSGERFKKKYGVDNYILYVGRIDEGKNCPEMFRQFRKYKSSCGNGLKLVTIGKAFIPTPNDPDIINLGFLEDDQDKYDGMAGAKMLWLPSKFESLSMVVLESMVVDTPVIVNGECPVLKGHCIKSNGAFYYENFSQLRQEIDFIVNCPAQVKVMCENAKKYAYDNYKWEVLVDRFSALIESI